MSDRGPGDVSRDAARSSPRDDGLSIVAGPHLLPSLGFFFFFVALANVHVRSNKLVQVKR